MEDRVRITVIATGFERTLPSRRQVLQQQYGQQGPATSSSSSSSERPAPSRQVPPRPAPPREEEEEKPKFSPDNIDIPAFLRRR